MNHGPNPQRIAAAAPMAGGPAMPPGRHSVRLEYTEASEIVVEGSVTRNRYVFSAAQRVQMVDSRDADALLRTRFFLQR